MEYGVDFQLAQSLSFINFPVMFLQGTSPSKAHKLNNGLMRYEKGVF